DKNVSFTPRCAGQNTIVEIRAGVSARRVRASWSDATSDRTRKTDPERDKLGIDLYRPPALCLRMLSAHRVVARGRAFPNHALLPLSPRTSRGVCPYWRRKRRLK